MGSTVRGQDLTPPLASTSPVKQSISDTPSDKGPAQKDFACALLPPDHPKRQKLGCPVVK